MSYETKAMADAGVLVLDCEHKTPEAQAHGFPYIAIPDIQGGRVIMDRVRRITESDLKLWTRRTIPRAGDLLVTRRGRVGDSAPIPADMRCAIGQNLVLLRSDEQQVRQDYLRWAVRSPQWWSEVDRLMNVGAVFSSLNVRDIARIRIPLPELGVQAGIAQVLGALDDKIAANTMLGATADEFAIVSLSRESVMIPLREAVNLRRRTVSPNAIAEPLVAHFSLPAFDSGQQPVIEPPQDIKSAKFHLDRPVVLLSKLNPRFPRVWNIDQVHAYPALASTEFLVLEPVRAANEVLWASLSQPKFSLALDAKVGGTSGSHQRVRPDDALDTPIIDPDAISSEMALKVVKSVRLAAQLRRESNTLAKLRDTLLPELMSGRLRVKDAEKKIEEVV